MVHEYRAKFYQSFLNSKRKTYLNLIIKNVKFYALQILNIKYLTIKYIIIYKHKNCKEKKKGKRKTNRKYSFSDKDSE